MRIGLFGGAFNPVHNGHINLANNYIDRLKLDKLVFIPTANPPHRSGENFVSGRDRINMLNIATRDNKNVEVSDIEFHLEGKSYTYNTVSFFKEKYKNDEFYLIVGADQFLNFKSWYKYEELLKMVTLCTAAREDKQLEQMKAFAICDDVISNSNYIIANIPVYVVSSSQVRQMIEQKQDVSQYLPKGVSEYIKDNDLYV